MTKFIGRKNNQVSTNAQLGGMAFQDSSNAAVGNIDIESISGSPDIKGFDKNVYDTAVDVFVYDTSKDSDGGAWRKRTSHTSWYNETLNTATRGSRREFPAVAVIVLTGDTSTSQATIYDGDDPDLPMWMVIPDQSIDWANNNGAPTSTAGLNGKICFTCSGSGVTILDFVSDTRFIHYIGQYTFTSRNILSRSSSAYSAGGNQNNIVNQLTNDVAMTVLPNAPIDSATGLQVPTIAVATNSGISVIKDDGTVVNKTTSVGGSYTATVDFTKDGYITATRNDYNYVIITPIDGTDSGSNISGFSLNVNYFRNDGNNYPGPNGSYDILNYGFSNRVISLNGSDVASADTHGLNIFDVVRPSTSSMVAYIASDYNSGYQHGNIKGAFLSDTDATNLSGTNLGLITNGDFSNGTTGWSSDQILTESGGVASVQRNAGSTGQCYQTITTEVGRTYTVSVNVTAYSNGFQVYAGESPTAANITMSQGAVNATGTHYWTFTATSTSTRLDFSAVQSGTATASFDDITIFDGVADRSANKKGLAVYGTITKSAVATGADLVAYSGWSTSNYLEQPPNTDMNVGTGDYYVMGWAYPTNNTTGYIWEYGQTLNTSGYTEMFYHDSGQFRFFLNGQGAVYGNVTSNTWNHFVAMRSSGVMYLYINGKLANQATNTSSLSNTSAKLRIGIRAYDINAPFYGKIALVRMGASAPSPEQVKKMYEDEKVLFQENAACTLYGSSDAVTALAYDEVTDRLHVGTSSGRSDFQGLRRINNTTKAVSTAISAHDGLIAQQ